MRQKKYRGPGKVRPTSQKVLESMMAILSPRLEQAKVLDLFAGTGQVGLRALERGADLVVFVEGDRRVADGLGEVVRNSVHRKACSIVRGRLPKVLTKVQGQFDLILADPPYDWKEPESLLPSALGLMAEDGLLVVEHHHKTEYACQPGWQVWRTEKFGETRLSFFEVLSSSFVHEPDDTRDDQHHGQKD